MISTCRRLKNVIKAKEKTLSEQADLDWGTCEALARTLSEGTHVRISGQDVQRGTFSHRHAIWHDQKTNEVYTALNNMARKSS